MKKVIVTGGMGFIGSEVCKKLIKNYKVISIDNLSTKKKKFENININIKQDIRSKKIINIFDKFNPDAVIHLAAIHHIPTCEKKRAYALDVNIVGTENLLEISSKFKIKKFILASSGAVYDWKNKKLNETKTSLKGSDNYSLSKLTNENQCNLWNQRTNINLIIARIFNTIGPNDPNAHLIPDILRQIKMNKKNITIKLGNTKSKRDYVDVLDTSQAIVSLLKYKSKKNNEIFNISSCKEYSVLDIVDRISKILGVDIKIEIDKNRIRKIDRKNQLGDNEKLKKINNWQPKININNSLSKIIKSIHD